MIFIKDLISVDIVTYGGEDKESGCDNYGIQFLQDDLIIEIAPEQAIKLCKKLKEHLEINGHKL